MTSSDAALGIAWIILIYGVFAVMWMTFPGDES